MPVKKRFVDITLILLCLHLTVWGQQYDKYYEDLPCQVKAVTFVAIPDYEVSITEFGAVGDGATLCTEAFKKAIDKVTENGGGKVVVPEGVWLTGPIQLKSNLELRVERNAIISFAPDKRLYLDKKKNAKRVLPCISASKSKNIAITGKGVIDGGGQYWRPVKHSKMSDVEWRRYLNMGGKVTAEGDLWYPWELENGYPDISETPKGQESMRNDLIRMSECENLRFEGVTIQNSPRFTLHPCFCQNIIIDGVKVRAEWNVQNADGIDLSDCHQVLIVNCDVSVGDDGICMKSGKPAKNRIAGCEDIVVQDNVVNHAHGGFVFGSETASGMRRMVVRHNTFSGTDAGLRFKSALDRGGRSEQIFISDIVMNDINSEAIVFQCNYVNAHAGSTVQEIVFTEEQKQWSPKFQDIHISRVVCRGCKTGIKAAGIEGLDCVKDITIKDCTIVYTHTDKQIDENTAKVTLNNVKLIADKAK